MFLRFRCAICISSLLSIVCVFLLCNLELMLLKPQYTSTSEPKVNLKADPVRKLITERVPVRLLYSPLLRICSNEITCWDSSVSIAICIWNILVGI